MKIFISFQMNNRPTGGGNQFLRSLRSYFCSKNCNAKDIDTADVVLYNSHHNIKEVARAKWLHPECIFAHRIDGPMAVYNQPGDRRDLVAYTAMKLIADCSIFQSEWSKNKNIELGIPIKKYNFTIVNAPDPAIFNRSGCKERLKSSKIRLIATSWSTHLGKGFDVYQWLDRNLDFTKYEMVFIGNTPVIFKNIRHIPPLRSSELANELKASDLFITASRIEACSNSLLEALHCGLPAIGPNESSNPHIIGKGGEVFNDLDEIPGLIELISKNYKAYQERISISNMEDVGRSYYNCINKVFNAAQDGVYIPKRLSFIGYMYVIFSLWLWKLHERYAGIKNKIASLH